MLLNNHQIKKVNNSKGFMKKKLFLQDSYQIRFFKLFKINNLKKQKKVPFMWIFYGNYIFNF